MRYFEKQALETAVVGKENSETKRYLQTQGFKSVSKKQYLQKDEELANKNVSSMDTAIKINKFTRRTIGGLTAGAIGAAVSGEVGRRLAKMNNSTPKLGKIMSIGGIVGAGIGAALTPTKDIDERGKLLTEKYLLHRAAIRDKINKDTSREYFVRE